MGQLLANVRFKFITSVLLLFFACQCIQANRADFYFTDGNAILSNDVDIVSLERQRRQTETAVNATAPAAPAAPAASSASANVTVPLASNTTLPETKKDTAAATTVATPNVLSTSEASVTKIPLLGVNGSGIHHDVDSNKSPKVSDPINPTDENIPDTFNETPERIKAQYNLTNIVIDHHDYYNSTFIGNETYFDEYWANITKPKPRVHTLLSNSHRRASTVKLPFQFPFYGLNITNISIATGGFIYVGEVSHNFLAATQFIAPMMANFDTRQTNDSYVKAYGDSERYIIFWEKVPLQEDANKTFTFALELLKNGDMIFAYKDMSLAVQQINDAKHPVKVGISDAFHTNNMVFNLPTKTIYEYHRVSFKDHEITNKTMIKLIALPTCVQYKSCNECIDHETVFNCTWCPVTNVCSSGTDKNQPKVKRCQADAVTEATQCTAPPRGNTSVENTAYTTDNQPNKHEQTIINTVPDTNTKHNVEAKTQKSIAPHKPSVGGAVAGFFLVSLICSLGIWVVYAFKNPHTRSGQMLIKYRPSQWNWRRGEARYTAATIHM